MKGDSNKRFSGKKVAVLGLGVDAGIDAVTFLLENGARPVVFDEKSGEELDQTALSLSKKLGVEVVTGPFKSFLDFDIILRSPGIRPDKGCLSEARRSGVEVTSSTKLFFEFADGVIVGVTGTKGKGTTASLIAEILKRAGKDVYLGGNIGVSMLSLLPKLKPESVSVCELSSFQLMDLTQSPHIAVVLMVTSEHLDYHISQDEYVEAKTPIAKFQTEADFIVANRDYAHSVFIAGKSKGRHRWVSKSGEVEEGCFIRAGKVFVRDRGREEEIIDTHDIFLPGPHNLENVCAATMAAKVLDVPNATIKETLKEFRGLPHRLELVGEAEGVRYFNDSFSTTPESAIAAIRAFTAPKIIILGGSSKGSDFAELGTLIARDPSVKCVIGIGVEWEKIKQAILDGKGHIPKFIEGCTSMPQIVLSAREAARPGEVVILSPACASFGMFKNYKDRGSQFKEAASRFIHSDNPK